MAMTELILSEITRMDPGYCVIGLEPSEGKYRSIRPGPPFGHAWLDPFPYKRGDKLLFQLTPSPMTRPHVEDHRSTGVLEKKGQLSEAELLSCLQKAESARCLRDLFGCQVRLKRRGAFVVGKLARRSICGTEAQKVRLKWEARELRASIVLSSCETLPDLPVVDRSWLLFVGAAFDAIKGANQGQRLNRYLARRFQKGILDGRNHFLRIGLTRPVPNVCWLMVDTLFPFPRKSWLNELHDEQAI